MRIGMRLLAAIAAGALLVAACGDEPTARGSATYAGGTDLQGSITVFAAASLTDAFEELATAFEADHEGVDVALNFAGSSSLREQILAGAPADVFASASNATMDEVVGAGAAGEPVTFVENRLQIAVSLGNPAEVTDLADFADGDLLVGLCAEEVPCGTFARAALAAAGVTPSIDTNEPDVRSLLIKLAEGELDAGIVYRTDVLAGGDAVEGIDIPAEQNVTAGYPIATLTEAANTEAAAAFVAYVRSPEAQAILRAYGFTTP